jgi:demethylmenaquinone methyltransferase/2-methoxy-6-polyprenyl-1,4-benzoquinol methylase
VTIAPIPQLEAAEAAQRAHQRFVDRLFDAAAADYDKVCARMDFGSGRRYRREALARHGLAPGMALLDVATGTGLVASAAADILGHSRGIVGFDPSEGMLRQAAGSALRLCLVRGVAQALPFASARFDFLTMGYALRHVPDLDTAFREYARVLKPGGRLLVLEISKPESRVGYAAAAAYFGVAVPLMARVGAGPDAARLMKYYWQTIDACVSPEIVLASMRRSGFADARRTVLRGILSEYSGTASAPSGQA